MPRGGLVDYLIDWLRERDIENEREAKLAQYSHVPSIMSVSYGIPKTDDLPKKNIGLVDHAIRCQRLLPYYCPRCTSQLHHDYVFPGEFNEDDVRNISANGGLRWMVEYAYSVKTCCEKCGWSEWVKNPYR